MRKVFQIRNRKLKLKYLTKLLQVPRDHTKTKFKWKEEQAFIYNK